VAFEDAVYDKHSGRVDKEEFFQRNKDLMLRCDTGAD
jgi:hypothetical protein